MTPSTVTRRAPARNVILVLIAALAILVPATATAAPSSQTTIQILDISDWHGQIDPINVAGVGNVGGAAVLSSYFKADRLANPNTLTLTAGDDFGATPPLSGFFEEVPAVLAQRLMGIQVGTFGNHNFDRPLTHLQEMIDLAGSTTEVGSPYSYVSANLKNRDAELSGVDDFKMFTIGGVNVAVVGITNPEAPNLVFAENFGSIVPTDPVPAANKAKAKAKAAGARVVIAITHMGVTGFDAEGNATGPLIDFANAVGGFDVIFGDHTDVKYSAVINGQLVVENSSKGVSYSRTNLTVQLPSGKVVDATNTFVTPLASAVTPDPAIVSMIDPYRIQLAAVFDGKIGVATGRFPRGGSPSVERSGEAAIGNIVADSMRLTYGTDFALTNGGGLRASLPSSYAPLDLSLDRTDPAPYDIVIGDIYTVLPFGNTVVTRPVTGSQLWAALENGVSQISAATCNGADGRFPQISGFKFSFKCSAAPGSRVLSVSKLDDTPIPNDGTTYTLATNDFVNAGNDFYTVFRDGQGVTRDIMANVFLEYVTELGTITPTIEGRITKVP